MNKPTFIWDLDGTLLDSYQVIVSSLHELYKEIGIDIDEKEILKEVIRTSVANFIKEIETKYHVPFDELKGRYSYISSTKKKDIKPMKGAIAILSFLQSNDIDNYVFTHRGVTTEEVLANTGLTPYFKEVVTSLNGYNRKPDPGGLNYLIDKYHLDKDNTYYVGDRVIDIECACNASIKSIMFIPPNGVAYPTDKATYVIKDLNEIKKIIEDNK